jgi:hypothetical protein
MATYDYITRSGTINPDTSSILTDVQTEYKEAFGDTLDVAPETPQGLLINAETLARQKVITNNAELANQLNPNLSGGIFLASVLALTGAEFGKSKPTLVVVTAAGQIGTLVTVDTRISMGITEPLFQPIDNFIIGPNGTATAIFQSLDLGPIPAPAGELTTIVLGPLGLETVTNEANGVLGVLTESDQAARLRRRNTLALQGMSLAEAIKSALYDLDGVKSLEFRENWNAFSIIIDGVTLIPHSIYACVDGGTQTDIVDVLNLKKTGGTGYNGNITVPTLNQFSGQVIDVKYSRPDDVPIVIEVTVKGGSAIVDPVGSVIAAVLAYANGEIDGEPGFVVGGAVSCFEIAGGVNQLVTGLFVSLVRISKVSPLSLSTDTIPIKISEVARIIGTNVTVIVT